MPEDFIAPSTQATLPRFSLANLGATQNWVLEQIQNIINGGTYKQLIMGIGNPNGVNTPTILPTQYVDITDPLNPYIYTNTQGGINQWVG